MDESKDQPPWMKSALMRVNLCNSLCLNYIVHKFDDTGKNRRTLKGKEIEQAGNACYNDPMQITQEMIAEQRSQETPASARKNTSRIWNRFTKKEGQGAEKRKKKNRKKKKPYGLSMTLFLIVLLLFLLSVLWSLFISGPERVHEDKLEARYSAIEEQVPGIQGLEENVFAYVTYQGYTTDTLYWFDETGAIITTREMSTLDYNKAREAALENYGMEADTVELAFGYSSPVYELKNGDTFLMLNYDTLERVYQRG